MVTFPELHRIRGIQVAAFRLNLLGGVGDFAKLALVDEESRPLAYAVTQKFSSRTLQLIEALRESLEQDVHDTFLDVGQLQSASPPDEDEGLTFR